MRGLGAGAPVHSEPDGAAISPSMEYRAVCRRCTVRAILTPIFGTVDYRLQLTAALQSLAPLHCMFYDLVGERGRLARKEELCM